MKTLWTIAASIFLGGICVAQSAPLSVADIARQNKADSKPPTVITNDDLSGGSQDAGATSGGTPTLPPEADAVTADASASSRDKSNKNDDSKTTSPKAKDDADITGLKEKLSSYQKEQDGWERSAKHWEDELASETTSDFRRETAEEALENDKRNIQYFQNKIDQTQSELDRAQQAAAARKRAEAQDNASGGSDQSSGSGTSGQDATSTSPPPVQR